MLDSSSIERGLACSRAEYVSECAQFVRRSSESFIIIDCTPLCVLGVSLSRGPRPVLSRQPGPRTPVPLTRLAVSSVLMTDSERVRSFPWLLAFSLAIPVLIFATVGVGFTVYTMNVGADALVRMPGRGGGNSDGLVTAADAARYWLILAAITTAVGAWLLTSVARKRRRLAKGTPPR